MKTREISKELNVVIYSNIPDKDAKGDCYELFGIVNRARQMGYRIIPFDSASVLGNVLVKSEREKFIVDEIRIMESNKSRFLSNGNFEAARLMKERNTLLKNKLEQIRAERFFNSRDAFNALNERTIVFTYTGNENIDQCLKRICTYE